MSPSDLKPYIKNVSKYLFYASIPTSFIATAISAAVHYPHMAEGHHQDPTSLTTPYSTGSTNFSTGLSTEFTTSNSTEDPTTMFSTGFTTGEATTPSDPNYIKDCLLHAPCLIFGSYFLLSTLGLSVYNAVDAYKSKQAKKMTEENELTNLNKSDYHANSYLSQTPVSTSSSGYVNIESSRDDTKIDMPRS